MNDRKNQIELLAPAGNMEKLETVLYYGADAVYLGGKSFGLRAQADNFDDGQLKLAVDKCHALGRKAFVTVNIFAKNKDFNELKEHLAFVQSIGADACIASDIGVIDCVLSNFPKLSLHISTQANTTNKHAAAFYAKLGASRIVLARELSFNEISEIRQFVPANVELEAFVHGAMCISYSGRCLLSNYLTDRDSNRGACVQACRWQYSITEKTRPGRQLEITEDSRGTYILNSKDLNMIEYIDKLHKAGIYSFKIEGRIKTGYYAAGVTNAYRRAIDCYLRNPDDYRLPVELQGELEKISNREYTTGFYLDGNDTVNLKSALPKQDYDFTALVLDYDAAKKTAFIEMRNRFCTGEELEILSPGGHFNKKITVPLMTDEDAKPLEDVYKVQQRVYMQTDIPLEKGDILRKKSKPLKDCKTEKS